MLGRRHARSSSACQCERKGPVRPSLAAESSENAGWPVSSQPYGYAPAPRAAGAIFQLAVGAVRAAADDRFAQLDVIGLTIAWATSTRGRRPRPGTARDDQRKDDAPAVALLLVISKRAPRVGWAQVIEHSAHDFGGSPPGHRRREGSSGCSRPRSMPRSTTASRRSSKGEDRRLLVVRSGALERRVAVGSGDHPGPGAEGQRQARRGRAADLQRILLRARGDRRS